SIAILAAAGAVATADLPSGWRVSPPSGAMTETGTMPQGISLSPSGSKIAIVESGFNPPALRIVSASDLHTIDEISLPGAFGSPAWQDERTVLVAGANANAVLRIDIETGSITRTPVPGWPAALAAHGDTIATADDDTSAISLVREGIGKEPAQIAAGSHPNGVAFSPDGRTIYVSNGGEATVTALDAASHRTQTIATDLHPSALVLSASGATLYVACADADAVDEIDTRKNAVVARIAVGLPQGPGASPNSLALDGDALYVSLGAENAIALIRDRRVVARAPVGWYPSGIAARNGAVYVVDGKGEGSRANPEFDPGAAKRAGYIAATLTGSVRKIDARSIGAESTQMVIADVPSPGPTPAQTIVRSHGPIEHVFYIIKENRTYDQVLGDLLEGNGDPKLAWFGERVTPNEHALARRFGIFDDTDADAQVSAGGHNWSTAAFANDYLERFWPVNYGGRRDLYDFEDGAVASTPANGYIWDEARKAGISMRDYGEFVSPALLGTYSTHMEGLKDRIDPRYPGFNLDISDETRVDEWQREFDAFAAQRNVPAFEIIRLPNDHTYGTRAGSLTPQAYVAQNDHAFGRIVDRISHSPYWSSSVVIAIEDDAQNGPDHVDNQRTTLYIASPYAAPGVHRAHYSTSGVVRTIELFLGLPPMSIYDAVAPPLYDAFGTVPEATPYTVLPPQIDVNAKNLRTAYGAAASARLDFTNADAADPAVLNDILEHAAHKGIQR
ncbi:MAG: bifunctional YncE family protein/alkaline phosphatase family protein, partial [Candidatus Baltobacteraceae bacterium]